MPSTVTGGSTTGPVGRAAAAGAGAGEAAAVLVGLSASFGSDIAGAVEAESLKTKKWCGVVLGKKREKKGERKTTIPIAQR